MIHPHTDDDCPYCMRPAGECTGDQCTASVKLLGGGVLVCHDEQHDVGHHHMQEIESYDVNDPQVGHVYRASHIIDVFWQISDKTLGDILDEVKESEKS